MLTALPGTQTSVTGVDTATSLPGFPTNTSHQAAWDFVSMLSWLDGPQALAHLYRCCWHLQVTEESSLAPRVRAAGSGRLVELQVPQGPAALVHCCYVEYISVGGG